MIRTVAIASIAALAGCSGLDKLPAGAQLQSSTFGVRIAPQAVDSAPFVLGSHATIVTTAQPADAGPNLNRFEGTAPGTHVKSTVASGPVGEELQKAGGPEAVRALVRPAEPIPLPRTDQRSAEPEDPDTLTAPDPRAFRRSDE